MSALEGLKFSYYFVDISYKIIDKIPYIILFGKSSTGKSLALVEAFKPYFYVMPEQGKENELKKDIEHINIDDKRLFKVDNIDFVERYYNGQVIKLLEVYVNMPEGVPKISLAASRLDLAKGIFEYDIPYTKRYLIDKKLVPLCFMDVQARKTSLDLNISVPYLEIESISNRTEELAELNIMAFDIESYNPTNRIDTKNNPILMIALYGESIKKVLTWKRFKTSFEFIEFVESEKDLLLRFQDILLRHKPDILTGYFSDGFDLPYIIERSKILGIKLRGLDNTEFKLNKRQGYAKVTGIGHIDIFKFIRRLYSKAINIDSFSLDSIAEKILGERKEAVDIKKLYQSWDENKNLGEYCKYNLKDAELTYKLTIKTLPNFAEFAKLIRQSIFEINRMSYSQYVEYFLMRLAYIFNILIPNKPTYFEKTMRSIDSFKGGYVFKPEPGLYKDIVVFDFKSLYPSIIVSHNISPETINCNCCKETAKKHKINDKEYWFCQKQEGFIPKALNELINRRSRIKEILKKKDNLVLRARSESLKILTNAFLGILVLAVQDGTSLNALRQSLI
jgi:DNA polymerase elongation subunit (family B)